MKSGVGPFREVRTGRAFLLMWRADPNEFHRYWPSLAEKEEAEFKRLELIAWKDEVRDGLFRGRSVWPAGRRNDVNYQYSHIIMNKRFIQCFRPSSRRVILNSIASILPCIFNCSKVCLR